MNKPNGTEKTFCGSRNFKCRMLVTSSRAAMCLYLGLLLVSGCSHVPQQASNPFTEAVATIKQSFSSPAPTAAVHSRNADQVVALPETAEVGRRQQNESSQRVTNPYNEIISNDVRALERPIESYESRIAATSVGHQLTDFAVTQAAYQQNSPSNSPSNSAPMVSTINNVDAQRDGYSQSPHGAPMPGQANFEPMSRFENHPPHPSVQFQRGLALQQHPAHARMRHPSQMEATSFARYQAGMNQNQQPVYAGGQPIRPQFAPMESDYQQNAYVPPYGPPQHYTDQMMTSYDAPHVFPSHALNDDSRNLVGGIGLHGSSLRQPPQTANELAIQLNNHNEVLVEHINKLKEQIGELEKEVKQQKLLVKKTKIQLAGFKHDSANLRQTLVEKRIQIEDLEKEKFEIGKKADLALKAIEKELDTMLMSTISQTPDP